MKEFVIFDTDILRALKGTDYVPLLKENIWRLVQPEKDFEKENVPCPPVSSKASKGTICDIFTI